MKIKNIKFERVLSLKTVEELKDLIAKAKETENRTYEFFLSAKRERRDYEKELFELDLLPYRNGSVAIVRLRRSQNGTHGYEKEYIEKECLIEIRDRLDTFSTSYDLLAYPRLADGSGFSKKYWIIRKEDILREVT